MSIEIREIQYGSREYALELELRNQILREPLGLKFSASDLEADKNDRHLVAVKDSRIVGCLVIHQDTATSIAKMRQVAVASEAQGFGIGARLVELAELLASRDHATEMVLNARETAVNFYLKLGYEIDGDAFTEVGLTHHRMRKLIGPPGSSPQRKPARD